MQNLPGMRWSFLKLCTAFKWYVLSVCLQKEKCIWTFWTSPAYGPELMECRHYPPLPKPHIHKYELLQYSVMNCTLKLFPFIKLTSILRFSCTGKVGSYWDGEGKSSGRRTAHLHWALGSSFQSKWKYTSTVKHIHVRRELACYSKLCISLVFVLLQSHASNHI